jgi:hypothetical protein
LLYPDKVSVDVSPKQIGFGEAVAVPAIGVPEHAEGAITLTE